MTPTTEDAANCSECGKRVTGSDNICPHCGNTVPADWEKEADRLKKLWVIAAVFFWFSVVFQGTLFILEGGLNLILLSVIGGMMVIGMVLKFRYQRHLRKNTHSK